MLLIQPVFSTDLACYYANAESVQCVSLCFLCGLKAVIYLEGQEGERVQG